jgi:hypothetical protein
LLESKARATRDILLKGTEEALRRRKVRRGKETVLVGNRAFQNEGSGLRQHHIMTSGDFAPSQLVRRLSGNRTRRLRQRRRALKFVINTSAGRVCTRYMRTSGTPAICFRRPDSCVACCRSLSAERAPRAVSTAGRARPGEADWPDNEVCRPARPEIISPRSW